MDTKLLDFGGEALTLFAGALGGTVLMPMKFVRGWAWESTWLCYSFCAYLIFPWLVAWTTVPNLWAVYRAVAADTLFWTSLFGFGWGIAVVLYGLAVDYVGLSLSSGILFGSSVAIGSLVPLLLLDASQVVTPSGLVLVTADAVMLCGVLLCAWAGDLREKAQSSSTPQTKGSNLRKGIAICFVAGILSTLFNVALTYGAPIIHQASAQGAGTLAATNAVWSLAVGFGSLPSILWCARSLSANRSWDRYRRTRASVNLALCVAMGALWVSSTVLYGTSTLLLGRLGPAIGWPVYMSAMILGNNFWGWWTGEWQGVSGRPVRAMLAGIAIQVASIALLGSI